MEESVRTILSQKDSQVRIQVLPGHFATSHSHITSYVDMTIMKCRMSEAKAAAAILAEEYTNTTYLDTIVCMDGCEVIGSCLADALTNSGVHSLNWHQTMYVVTPDRNADGQLIFSDNMQMMISGKHCLLLLASATTGRTIERAMECIKYYGGVLEGVSAIFSVCSEVKGMQVNSIFTKEDLGEYESYDPSACPLCAQGAKIDAMVNSFGYSKL